ncbi:MAG: hypothetical protein E7590_02215 [Ruminococcaceae bacterium]|nr:hypothetical protein [Oscillospiraceae bacterium]
MKKDFFATDWQRYLPHPVCGAHPEYDAFYQRAWELARDHVKHIPGLPQSPYMDEGLCDTQIWIWDTCFMALYCKFAPEVFPGVESFRNFYEVLVNGRILPEVIPGADEPFWTKATPGVPIPLKVHIADNPPLFAFAEYENAMMHGDAEYVKDLLYNKRSLQGHYEWVESLTERITLPGVLLPTYLRHEECGYTWEGGSSGMDNTPRGKKTPRFEKERPNNPDMLWVDAICQQALSAKCIAKLFALVGDTEGEAEWNARFAEKQRLVNDLYWDDRDSFYYDIDRNDHSFYRVMTTASYWALTAGIATEERAAAMVARAEDPETLGGDLPLLSLARNDPDFAETGRYWRGALWLPTAYASLKGISAYGYQKSAHVAAKKILQYMLKTYEDYEPHTIWECYAPVGHRPADNPRGTATVRHDFCGWSALGPISIYLEYVLGFHTINAFTSTVEWEKPEDMGDRIGVENLRFGNVVTDIIAEGDRCHVRSNLPFTLRINGRAYEIAAGENTFTIRKES